ncbi:MAG: hypothetical protein B9S38_14850 [Verrucomicrobiia bacterium Tous-C4TDCM]|nr:MAG: hypothetical protein B9S38_14850 [Verrucomicrobiae bacterium Tous-C4TDCM]
MKTNRNTIANLIIASAALITVSASSAVNRTLILLQENNDGSSYMTGALPAGPVRDAADAIVDSFIEGGEATKLQALAAGRYQRFVNLSDSACTRANLLAELIRQSKDGFITDLAVLGHGSPESLRLNGENLTGQTTTTLVNPITGTRSTFTNTGSIRTLLSDARATQGSAFNFKLRLVHMCNCFGGTTNDDWLAIGAKTSVGAPLMNWMPEPMITFFWDDFVKNDKRAIQAAADSLVATRILWQAVPGYTTVQSNGLTKIQETQQVVAGNGNLIFKDEYQLALNQSRTVTVQANQTHNFPSVYLVAGQKYTFTSGSTDTWQNGIAPFATTVNAIGYTPGPIDALRRHPANMMRLIGERFTHPNGSALNFIGGSGFSIGRTLTHTASGHGFLNLYANDNILAYGDNSGSIAVTIKRIE